MKYGLSTSTPQLAWSKAEQVSAGWDAWGLILNPWIKSRNMEITQDCLKAEQKFLLLQTLWVVVFFFPLTPPTPAHKGLTPTPPTYLASLVSLPFQFHQTLPCYLITGLVDLLCGVWSWMRSDKRLTPLQFCSIAKLGWVGWFLSQVAKSCISSLKILESGRGDEIYIFWLFTDRSASVSKLEIWAMDEAISQRLSENPSRQHQRDHFYSHIFIPGVSQPQRF